MLGTALGLWLAPAAAEWQYTRWGMSPAEVVAASNGKARLAKPDKATNTVFGSTGAEADYSEPPYSFRVVFNFRYDKLTQVTLHPVGKTDCTPIANGLIARLGPPAIDSLYTGITKYAWTNTARATDVTLLRVPEACAILYIQHGVVPARAPEGRERPEELGTGPSQQTPKAKHKGGATAAPSDSGSTAPSHL